MHDPESSHDTLDGFEAQLAGLTPRARLDRDSLMFAAGRSAGARPLRVVNRLLATTSVALAAFAIAVVAMPRFVNQSLERSELPTAADVTLAEAGVDDAPTDGARRPSMATIDGPTRLRLRQRLALGVDDQVALPTRRAPLVEFVPEVSPRSHTRGLLKRYLKSNPNHL